MRHLAMLGQRLTCVPRVRAAGMLAAASLHLALVASSAAHESPLSESTTAGRVVRAYGDFSGANNSYGFFAPSVASEVRARFVLVDPRGLRYGDSLKAGKPEVDLRVHTLLNFFPVNEAQDLFARSWAALMLGRHPGADTVVVLVDIYDLPTMRAWRDGARPSWSPFYRGTFARAANAGRRAGT